MNAVVVTLLIVLGLCVAGRMAQSRTGFVALLLLLVLVVLPVMGWRAVTQRHYGAAVRAQEQAQRAHGMAAEAARRAAGKSSTDRADAATEEAHTISQAQTPAADAGLRAEASRDIEIEAEPGRVVIPPRPSWVEAAPVLEGAVHTIAVSSGPHETVAECERALDRQMERAVDDYVDAYFENAYRGRLKPTEILGYDAAHIRSHLLGATPIYREVVQVSFGPMHQVHALLHFSAAFRLELNDQRGTLDDRLQQQAVSGHLAIIGLVFGGALALLLVVWGYFKLDHVTRGYYSGRLQLLSVVAILGLVVVGIFLARHIPGV